MAEKSTPTTTDPFVDLQGFKEFAAPGDMVEGIYVGCYQEEPYTDEDGMPHKPLMQHILMNDNGLVRFNETAQTRMLRGIQPGTEVRVVFIDEVKTTSGFRVRRFNLMVRKSILQETAEGLLVAQQQRRLLPEPPQVDKDPFADD